ncbi:MAG: carbon-nitrogen hydrolase [Aquificae bacterium]|nr:carbon-nitrogen hydrolase [Aquificota bacterium]
MEKRIKIALLQMSSSKDIEENEKKAVSLIKKATKKGAKIVCTQELFKTEYFPQVERWSYFRYAEKINENSKSIKKYQKLAKELNVVLILSLFEKRADGIYHNTAVVIDADGRYLGKYRKMHIPDDPHFYEKFYFTPGDLGYKVFDTKYGKIGVLICWDQWFPEAARLTAMKGAKIIFYPTAIGWLPSEKEKYGKSQYNAWETIQRSHAVANGIYVASVNRVGFEESPDKDEGIEFWGKSFISNPYGEIIKQASSKREEIVLADVDLSVIDEIRTSWPFFRDRRIDSYKELQKRWLEDE